MMSTGQPQSVFDELGRSYPDAHCELDFASVFQLLIATVLSAQTTDVRVNQVTPQLFGRWADAQHLAAAPQPEVEQIIRPCGFFRTKAAAIIALSAQLVADHDGEVPADQAALVRLPGVGRKTANVVLADGFGIPGLTVDTHFARLSARFGWTSSIKPGAIEKDVAALFPRRDWNQLNHRLIWHGRRRCHSRRPDCVGCPVQQWCVFYREMVGT